MFSASKVVNTASTNEFDPSALDSYKSVLILSSIPLRASGPWLPELALFDSFIVTLPTVAPSRDSIITADPLGISWLIELTLPVTS